MAGAAEGRDFERWRSGASSSGSVLERTQETVRVTVSVCDVCVSNTLTSEGDSRAADGDNILHTQSKITTTNGLFTVTPPTSGE